MTNPKTSKGPALPLNELKRIDGQERNAPSRDIPDALKAHYHQDGNAFRSAHRADKIEFVDRGSRMHAYRPVSQFTVRSLVQVAEHRGWKALELTGDAVFRSRAYVEAASRGIDVVGYNPTEKDREILQRRADRAAAASNPKVQAFVAARSEADMASAVKTYPDLKDAFAARAMVHKFGDAIPDPKGRANWEGAMVDRLVLAVHRGEKLPEIKVRDNSRSAQPEAGQDR